MDMALLNLTLLHLTLLHLPLPDRALPDRALHASRALLLAAIHHHPQSMGPGVQLARQARSWPYWPGVPSPSSAACGAPSAGH